jgi:WD40 repeat protein
VRLWDPGTGSPAGDPLTGHTRPVRAVTFGTLPDGRVLLASGSWDGTVRLWDPGTGTPVGVPLPGHTDMVFTVAFGALPDGQVMLASGSVDGTMRLWDPAQPSDGALRAYDVTPFNPTTLAFERTTIYLGGSDGLIAIDLTSDLPKVLPQT